MRKTWSVSDASPSRPRPRPSSSSSLQSRSVGVVHQRANNDYAATAAALIEDNEEEFSTPLLVRKLSVFRKGLVRERNLRTQAEFTVDRLKEKMRLLQHQYDEIARQARDHKEHRLSLEKKVARTSEQRTNEKRLDSIFGQFGTRNVFEHENQQLKEKVATLRRQRNNAGARIEELEKQLQEIHTAGLTHSELFASVDREMVVRDQALSELKSERQRMGTELSECREELEKEREEWEKERKQYQEQHLQHQQQHQHQQHQHQQHPHQHQQNEGERKDGNITSTSDTNSNTIDEENNIFALRTCLEQQHQKMEVIKQRANTLERFWVEASQYDAFVVKFELYKLRKVLSRRPATIVVRRPIHQRDRSGKEELGGISVIVTRSGETFIHPAETIAEVSLLSREKGTRGISSNERAFKLQYSDGSKTDWFEGSCHKEVMEMLRIALGLHVCNKE